METRKPSKTKEICMKSGNTVQKEHLCLSGLGNGFSHGKPGIDSCWQVADIQNDTGKVPLRTTLNGLRYPRYHADI